MAGPDNGVAAWALERHQLPRPAGPGRRTLARRQQSPGFAGLFRRGVCPPAKPAWPMSTRLTGPQPARWFGGISTSAVVRGWRSASCCRPCAADRSAGPNDRSRLGAAGRRCPPNLSSRRMVSVLCFIADGGCTSGADIGRRRSIKHPLDAPSDLCRIICSGLWTAGRGGQKCAVRSPSCASLAFERHHARTEVEPAFDRKVACPPSIPAQDMALEEQAAVECM